MKSTDEGSDVERLAALELHFLEMTKIIKGLRRHLDEVAESVRITVEELRAARGGTRRSKVTRAARRRPIATTRAGKARRAAPGRH